MSRPVSHYFSPQAPPLDEAALYWTSARARGALLRFATGAGVFSKSGLDDGSRLLIETALDSPLEPVVEVQMNVDLEARLNAAVARVLAQLPQGAPYIEPKHVAPLLNIGQNAFTYHCRNCPQLRTWRGGSWRFFLDDPGHVEALKAVIKLVLWSGRKLPAELRLTHSAPPEPGAHLCDLGCGWGAIACFAAALSPGARVFGCDINERAVALARRNAHANGLDNAFFWCGDGLDAARDGFFDMILCNPPVRAGNEVIARLFDGARRCLKPDGTFWVVLRTAQGAKSWQKRLATQFGHCETAAIKGGYRILQCKMQD